MSRRPFIVFVTRATADKWGASISRRLTGSLGKPSTGESADLLDADGKVALFDSREEAESAAHAAQAAGKPWSPVRQWRSY